MSIAIVEVQFDKDGNLVIPSQESDIIQALTAPGNTFTDVVAISHGWNNDMDEARTLYRTFFGALEQVLPAATGKTLAIGILWPSKRFADADLIAGGAASAEGDSLPDSVLLDRLEELKHLFTDNEANAKLEQMKGLVAGLKSTDNQNQFVSLLGAILDKHSDPAQRTPDEGEATISSRAQDDGGAKLLKDFGKPVTQVVKADGEGGAAGLGGLGGNRALGADGPGAAAGISDLLTGIKAGALRLLNFTTYSTMKDRAGKIGRDAVNPLLQRIQAAVPDKLKFHLVGHSFGGRLVTAAVDGQKPLKVQTLLLLQAAYSHNGLAAHFDPQDPSKSGFFHAVFDNRKVSGPIVITHSKNDRAVGLAYPLASRLNGDDAAGIGDANDLFGGMGANGAQHVDVADITLLNIGVGQYDFKTSGKSVFNVNGDAIITSHGDVARPETAALLAAAMTL
jgi:hypothetical protein